MAEEQDNLRAGALLAHFATFYEEVARINVAIREGRLPLYLASGTLSAKPSLNSSELAALVSERLKNRLQEQGRYIRRVGTQAEIDRYEVAQFVMAALADELFILELDWPAKQDWQQHLLEQSVHGTSCAGVKFFEYLDELLAAQVVGPLEEELAAVFLMSLRLGFKGQYRGSEGEPELAKRSVRLLRFVGSPAPSQLPRFQQAYQYRLVNAIDERIAPLSRWYLWGKVAVVLYILISTVVWAMLHYQLNHVVTRV